MLSCYDFSKMFHMVLEVRCTCTLEWSVFFFLLSDFEEQEMMVTDVKRNFQLLKIVVNKLEL